MAVILEENFPNNQASGWPNAQVGGAWTVSGSASVIVAGNFGQHLHISTNQTHSARAASATGQDVDLRGRVSIDKLMTGSNLDVHVGVRAIDGSNMYRLRLRFTTGAAVQATLQSVIANAGTDITTGVTAGTHVAGDFWWFRVQAFNVSPTTLRYKVWKMGDPEPADWTEPAVTDSTAALQSAAGGQTVRSFQSAASNLPLTPSFKDLLAVTYAAGVPTTALIWGM